MGEQQLICTGSDIIWWLYCSPPGSGYGNYMGGGSFCLCAILLTCAHADISSPMHFSSFRDKRSKTFSCLALVCSVLSLFLGVDPWSWFVSDLLLPAPPCPGIASLYQMASDWWIWRLEALDSQFPPVPAGLLPYFSSKVQEVEHSSWLGDFSSTLPPCQGVHFEASNPPFSKTVTAVLMAAIKLLCHQVTVLLSMQKCSSSSSLHMWRISSIPFGRHALAEWFSMCLLLTS